MTTPRLAQVLLIDNSGALPDQQFNFLPPPSSTIRFDSAAFPTGPVCAVVVQRHGARGNRNAHPALRAPVLVGVGDGAVADSALRYAGEQARTCGVDLLLVRAWTPSGRDAGRVEEEADVLAASIRAARHMFPQVSVVGRLVQGAVDEVLLAEAAHAQLLVIGVAERPRHGAAFGRADRILVHEADCPVALAWQPDSAPIAAQPSISRIGGTGTPAERRAHRRWFPSEN